ncbi:palmitoyltransferase ZDHHC15B-like [Nilaparvata lugens]|uniref:palmitoyltransferase ZDHHC15B-like n=1 Tax=Nilaparvata lugens TaxID=108931 RepID=UPI00193CDA7E|nr:palmitoyltransferase ZDHHC15B-like [Nilaparvata lugens]
MSILSWLPVLLILSYLLISYIAYVFIYCPSSSTTIGECIINLLIFNVCFIMMMWSFLQTVFTAPGEIPSEFWLNSYDLQRVTRSQSQQSRSMLLENIARNRKLSLATIQYDGSGLIRYCAECYVIKPDRAHHCARCGVCVPKMDHHCPWTNNCISFTNYKFFILFLSYLNLFFILFLSTSFTFLYHISKLMTLELQSKNDSLHVIQRVGLGNLIFLIIYVINSSVAVVTIIFMVYHYSLTLNNMTTIEALRPPVFVSEDIEGYDLGKCENFEEVFGNNILLWFVPIQTSYGDGIKFSIRSQNLLDQEQYWYS